MKSFYRKMHGPVSRVNWLNLRILEKCSEEQQQVNIQYKAVVIRRGNVA